MQHTIRLTAVVSLVACGLSGCETLGSFAEVAVPIVAGGYIQARTGVASSIPKYVPSKSGSSAVTAPRTSAPASAPPVRTYSTASSASSSSTTPRYVPATSSSTPTPASSERKRYPGNDLMHCVRLVNNGNTLASFIKNSCPFRVGVSFIPRDGYGAGTRGLSHVGANGTQSTNRTSSLDRVIVCRGYDHPDAKTGYCNAN